MKTNFGDTRNSRETSLSENRLGLSAINSNNQSRQLMAGIAQAVTTSRADSEEISGVRRSEATLPVQNSNPMSTISSIPDNILNQ